MYYVVALQRSELRPRGPRCAVGQWGDCVAGGRLLWPSLSRALRDVNCICDTRNLPSLRCYHSMYVRPHSPSRLLLIEIPHMPRMRLRLVPSRSHLVLRLSFMLTLAHLQTGSSSSTNTVRNAHYLLGTKSANALTPLLLLETDSANSPCQLPGSGSYLGLPL